MVDSSRSTVVGEGVSVEFRIGEVFPFGVDKYGFRCCSYASLIDVIDGMFFADSTNDSSATN